MQQFIEMHFYVNSNPGVIIYFNISCIIGAEDLWKVSCIFLTYRLTCNRNIDYFSFQSSVVYSPQVIDILLNIDF